MRGAVIHLRHVQTRYRAFGCKTPSYYKVLGCPLLRSFRGWLLFRFLFAPDATCLVLACQDNRHEVARRESVQLFVGVRRDSRCGRECRRDRGCVSGPGYIIMSAWLATHGRILHSMCDMKHSLACSFADARRMACATLQPLCSQSAPRPSGSQTCHVQRLVSWVVAYYEVLVTKHMYFSEASAGRRLLSKLALLG